MVSAFVQGWLASMPEARATTVLVEGGERSCCALCTPAALPCPHLFSLHGSGAANINIVNAHSSVKRVRTRQGFFKLTGIAETCGNRNLEGRLLQLAAMQAFLMTTARRLRWLLGLDWQKLFGWLSKLWSLFGYPKYQVPYYKRDPKKGP